MTGGTRGIGLAIAERFCREEATVVVAGRPTGSGEEVADKLRREGHDVIFESVDMADVNSVQRMVGRVATCRGGIDVLVNNAGILASSLVRRLQVEEWNEIMAVNLTGPVFCMQAVRACMAEQGRGGRIINMSSIAGIDGGAGLAGYAASKAGMIAATRVAAIEFARDGICVNAIAPGMIETDMTSTIPGGSRQTIVGDIPLGRMGLPGDITGLATLLASADGSYITGQVIRVDGGLNF